MPLGVKPECHLCKITHSNIWRKNEDGDTLCNACSLRPHSSQSRRTHTNVNVRRSTRSKSSRKNAKYQNTTKGKGRRIAFKKTPPSKIPRVSPTVTTTEHFFYKSQYVQVGDIVSFNGKRNVRLYAQIYGLVIDKCGEKAAYLRWLLPKRPDIAVSSFEADEYILGPKDELPRKMKYLEFVCSAPTDLYETENAPYRMPPSIKDTGFISVNFGLKVLNELVESEETPPVNVEPPTVTIDDEPQPCCSKTLTDL